MTTASPVDWPTRNLEDLASIYSGGTPSRAVPAYWGGDIPWVTTTEIDFGHIKATRQQITELGLNASAARIAGPRTILLAMYGQGKTRGKSAMLDIAAAMNQACAAIVPGKLLDPEYLLYYLTLRYEAIRQMSNSGGQENLSGEIVRKIAVLLPPLEEQRRIAAALVAADRFICGLQRVIIKKRDVSQAIRQELLSGRTRLQSGVGDWSRVTLGETGNVSSGGVDKKTRPDERRTLLLNYMDVYRSEFLDAALLQQEVSAPLAKISKCSISAGDVFFTPTSETPEDIARSAVATLDMPGVVYSYHVVRWRPDSSWDSTYLGYAFDTKEFRGQVFALASGSGTRYVIGLPGFRSLKVMRPPISEQRLIGGVLKSTSDELNLLERRLELARAVKQGMMQELLTGRTRLVPQEVSA